MKTLLLIVMLLLGPLLWAFAWRGAGTAAAALRGNPIRGNRGAPRAQGLGHR